MRQAKIYCNKMYAGMLTEENADNYVFKYDENYFSDKDKPAISLTIPKTQVEFRSDVLFPFFYNMLSEGVNRKLQCNFLKIDERDNFGLLLATAQYDTIGAITVEEIKNIQQMK